LSVGGNPFLSEFKVDVHGLWHLLGTGHERCTSALVHSLVAEVLQSRHRVLRFVDMRGVHGLPVLIDFGAVGSCFASVYEVIDRLLVALLTSSLFNEGIVGGWAVATLVLGSGVIVALAVDDLVLQELGKVTVVFSSILACALVLVERATRRAGKHRRSKFAFVLARRDLISGTRANSNLITIGFQFPLNRVAISRSLLGRHHG